MGGGGGKGKEKISRALYSRQRRTERGREGGREVGWRGGMTIRFHRARMQARVNALTRLFLGVRDRISAAGRRADTAHRDARSARICLFRADK